MKNWMHFEKNKLLILKEGEELKRPMPLPVSVTDYMLLDQMGYEVIFLDNKPIQVVPKSNRLIFSSTELVRDIQKAFKNLTKMAERRQQM